MSAELATIASCTDLTIEHATVALRSEREMLALLDRVAAIAHPDDGCPTILVPLSHLADCAWFDGDVRIELSGNMMTTTLDVFAEHAGVRERALQRIVFAVPLAEFEHAVTTAPELVAPLTMKERVEDEQGVRIVLVADGQTSTVPPPAFELADECLTFGANEKPTVKRLVALNPEAFRSGKHRRFEP